MPPISPQDFWTVVGILVAVILALGTGFLRVWSDHAKARELRWRKAIFFAKIVSDESEAELTRGIARIGLLDLKVIKDEVASSTSLLERLLAPIGGKVSSEELSVLNEVDEEVIAIDPAVSEIDADLTFAKKVATAIASAVWNIEHSFEEARLAQRPEEDAQVRIFLIQCSFVVTFILISIAAMVTALA
ncbi:MAG: hypothetical protein KKF88_03750 [Alphaproteobacteria bacterium]|nr:hypothetical protein [Alphaproteobacteria bacterium]